MKFLVKQSFRQKHSNVCGPEYHQSQTKHNLWVHVQTTRLFGPFQSIGKFCQPKTTPYISRDSIYLSIYSNLRPWYCLDFLLARQSDYFIPTTDQPHIDSVFVNNPEQVKIQWTLTIISFSFALLASLGNIILSFKQPMGLWVSITHSFQWKF